MSNNEWFELTILASAAVIEGRAQEGKTYFQKALQDARSRRAPQDIYNTLCNFADLLLQLDEFAEAEKMLREATQLSFDHSQRLGVLTAWVTLEKLLIFQNRLQEVEEVCSAVAENSLEKYGSRSFRYMMDLLHLAKFYGMCARNMEKSRLLFNKVIEWAKSIDGDTATLNTIYKHYSQVLNQSMS